MNTLVIYTRLKTEMMRKNQIGSSRSESSSLDTGKINMILIPLYLLFPNNKLEEEEFDGPAVSTLCVRSQNLSNVRKGQSSDG
jgi:hypothetical protein